MKTFLNALLSVLGFFCSILMDGLYLICDLFDRPKGQNARFGHESLIASRFNKGFLISRNGKLTRRKSRENFLLIAPTGAGKTSRIIFKLLCELKHCSIIINDPSGEIGAGISGYLAQFFTVKFLNYTSFAKSCGYNMLSRITKASDVNKIADLLVRATIDKNSNDPFWGLQTRALLTILIRLVLYQPKEYQNMANVLHVLNTFAADPEKVDVLISKTDPKLILDYKALISTPEKTLSNIVASARSSLLMFEDEQIAKVTAYDSIDFTKLRENPTIIFLNNTISDLKYVNTLNSIFFEQLFNFILSRIPAKDELDIFNVIDEAGSIFINGLSTALSNARKYACGTVLCCQSTNQISSLYKDEAVNIISNCLTKLYMGGQTSLDTLREIEALSGKTVYKDEKGIERQRQLITVDEIRQLPKNRSLILADNHPMIKGRTSPYYKSAKYKTYCKIPAIEMKGDIPEGPIKLITDYVPAQQMNQEGTV